MASITGKTWVDGFRGPQIMAADLNKIDVAVGELKPAVDTLQQAVMPVGSIVAYGGTSDVPGWMICDGRYLSRTQYPALYAVLGVAYGTSTTNNFRLPDLRGRAPWGKATSGALGAVGRSGGAETVTLSVSQIPAHNHNATSGGRTMGMWKTNAGGGSQWELLSTSGGSQVSGFEISNTGGGQAHENMPPHVVVGGWIIRVQ